TLFHPGFHRLCRRRQHLFFGSARPSGLRLLDEHPRGSRRGRGGFDPRLPHGDLPHVHGHGSRRPRRRCSHRAVPPGGRAGSHLLLHPRRGRPHHPGLAPRTSPSPARLTHQPSTPVTAHPSRTTARSRKLAIRDITAYAHLSEEDLAEIGRRFDKIEKRHRDTLGEKDAAYIRGLIRTQRGIELLSRLATVFLPQATIPAAATMGLSKILENLEIGHNVM